MKIFKQRYTHVDLFKDISNLVELYDKSVGTLRMKQFISYTTKRTLKRNLIHKRKRLDVCALKWNVNELNCMEDFTMSLHTRFKPQKRLKIKPTYCCSSKISQTEHLHYRPLSVVNSIKSKSSCMISPMLMLRAIHYLSMFLIIILKIITYYFNFTSNFTYLKITMIWQHKT